MDREATTLATVVPTTRDTAVLVIHDMEDLTTRVTLVVTVEEVQAMEMVLV